MAENSIHNSCESSDSIMTILDQMAESVQLDYTEQFSTDVEPSSSGLLDLEPSKVCFDTNSRVFYHTVKPRFMELLDSEQRRNLNNLQILNFLLTNSTLT